MLDPISHPSQWPQYRTSLAYKLDQPMREYRRALQRWREKDGNPANKPVYPRQGKDTGQWVTQLKQMMTNIDKLVSEYNYWQWRYQINAKPWVKQKRDQKHDEAMEAITVVQRFAVEYKLKDI